MAVGRITLGYRDHEAERRQLSFEIAEGSAANHDAQQTALDGVQAAIDAISTGVRYLDSRANHHDYDLSGGTPASGFAQAQSQWRLVFQDTADAQFTVRVPCADLTLLATGTNQMDKTSSEYIALQTALDSFVLNPDTGDAGTLIDAFFIED